MFDWLYENELAEGPVEVLPVIVTVESEKSVATPLYVLTTWLVTAKLSLPTRRRKRCIDRPCCYRNHWRQRRPRPDRGRTSSNSPRRRRRRWTEPLIECVSFKPKLSCDVVAVSEMVMTP